MQHQLEWHPVLRPQLLDKLWLFRLSKPGHLNRQLTEERVRLRMGFPLSHVFFCLFHYFYLIFLKLHRKSCPSLSSSTLLSPPQDSLSPSQSWSTPLRGWKSTVPASCHTGPQAATAGQDLRQQSPAQDLESHPDSITENCYLLRKNPMKHCKNHMQRMRNTFPLSRNFMKCPS